MIKKNQRIINIFNMMLDIALAFGICLALLPGFAPARAALFACCVWLALALQGFYNMDRLYRLRQKTGMIVIAVLLSALLLLGLFYRGALPERTERLLSVILLPAAAKARRGKQRRPSANRSTTCQVMVSISMLARTIIRMRKSLSRSPQAATGGFMPKASPAPM